MKVCNSCGVRKELSEFYKKERGFLGLSCNCKSCFNLRVRDYARTKKGLVTRIYAHQKHSSKQRGHSEPNYSKAELTAWIFSNKNFNELYEHWVSSNYNKKFTPSCDRTDDTKGYCLTRLRLVTWKENNAKQHSNEVSGIDKRRYVGIVAIDKYGNDSRYESIISAARKLKLDAGSIIKCCKRQRQTAGGYHWFYEKEYNLLYS